VNLDENFGSSLHQKLISSTEILQGLENIIKNSIGLFVVISSYGYILHFCTPDLCSGEARRE
jgi:hypothetical protein